MRLSVILCQVGLLLAVVLPCVAALADTMEIEIAGLQSEALLKNVNAHVGSTWVSSTALSTQRKRDLFREQAEIKTARALQPYGYYFPEIESSLEHPDGESWVLKLTITPGEAMKVRKLELKVKGEGRQLPAILAWQSDWPLPSGSILNQVTWDEQKEVVLNLTEDNGYLSASFEAHRIDLDLEANVADLVLILDTGPRAVMGEVRFNQSEVKNQVLMSIPRFETGDYYSAWLVDKLRTDLWKTGYFGDIEVIEKRLLDQHPPVVEFEATLGARKRDTHQGTVGYGTDSEFRVQYRWQRHVFSERGDSLGIGMGWQQRNEELLLYGEYRIPRRWRSNQYWVLSSALKTESEDFNLGSDATENNTTLFSGRVEDFSVRFGRLKFRDLSWSHERIIETAYVQYLTESNNFPEDRLIPASRDGIENNNRSITLGLDWDWPVIQGKRFNTRGHHERAWVFTANDIWGSQREFTQVYLSSRWNFVLSDRWKLLLRGEAGYTDADVFKVDIGDDYPLVSVTELPFLYRFKAGGSYSVRGYGFEQLSTNNIGSNHIFTASTEVEYQFKQDWSLAAFYDIGNAFNDWSDMGLRTGIGVGIRWYSIAGVIRLDLAQAQDIDGKPWHIHLTIGTPLL